MTNKVPCVCRPHETFSAHEAHGATDDCSLRSGNQEADALASGVCDALDPQRRIHESTNQLQWDILPLALRVGKQAEAEYQKVKSKGQLPDRCRQETRRKPEDRLGVADPW